MAINEHGHEVNPCARCGEETEQNNGLWLCAGCAGGSTKKKAAPAEAEEPRTGRGGRR